METINKDREKYLNRFSDKPFTEHDFVATLFPLLCQNGIYKIQEQELEEKLFPYYKKKEFKELFQEIVPAKGIINLERVNLYEGLYQEKYFGGNVWFEQIHSDLLHLAYDKETDFSYYEEGLSEEGKAKMRQMARELAKTYQAEQKSKNRLQIFNADPNRLYLLVHGKRLGNVVGFDLLTDGEIETIEYPETREHYFYISPLDPNVAVQLKDNHVAHVTIRNATYTIQRGFSKQDLRYGLVNTNCLEEDTLTKLVEIANQSQEEEGTFLTKEAPFVKQIRLK